PQNQYSIHLLTPTGNDKLLIIASYKRCAGFAEKGSLQAICQPFCTPNTVIYRRRPDPESASEGKVVHASMKIAEMDPGVGGAHGAGGYFTGHECWEGCCD